MYLTRSPFSRNDENSSSFQEFCSKDYLVNGTECIIGGAGAMNLNSTSCRITVTSGSLGADKEGFLAGGVPTLYWCSSNLQSTTAYLSIANISTITTTPPFIFSDVTSTTLTVNSATPVGTEIGFYSTEECQEPLNKSYPIKLPASRKLTTSALPTGNVAYLCAKVFYSLSSSDTGSVPASTADGGSGKGSSAEVIVFGALYSSVRYRTFSPTEGLRYTNVSIMTNGVSSAFSLSYDPYCLDLAQNPQYPSPSSGSLVLYLSAPMGTYYFCGITVSTAGGGVFVPAEDQFTVLEYGVTPTSMYTLIRMRISLTKNATTGTDGETFQSSLFLDASCQLFAPNFSWTDSLYWPEITSPGTYYACVRKKADPLTTTALANAIKVLPTPSLQLTNPTVND